jgi:hypothetical protein
MNTVRPTFRRLFLQWFLALYLTAGGGLPAAGEEVDWRKWRSTAGTEIEARLVFKGPADAVLEKRDGKRITVKLSLLSPEDLKFLSEGDRPPPEVKIGETTIAGLEAVPGKTSEEIACQASPEWSYFLYLPNRFHTGQSWPVCFIMDPSGSSAKTLNRYLPAAEHLGMILAASKQSKNEFADSGDAIMAMIKDVYSRVPVLPDLAIASGMSGGCRMAYLIAETETNIAGILACGAGNGVYPKEAPFRRANLRRGTVICSLIGTNDYNRREAFRTHKEYKKDSRFIWFPGNHDWAPAELISEGMSYLFAEVLKNGKAPNLERLRSDFAKNQLAFAKTGQEQAPWATYRWAEYLAGFPGGAQNQSDARSLAAKLAASPEVTRALEAEKEVEEFADKHFSNGNTNLDKTPDAQREKEAQRKAESMKGLPHSELVSMLGAPPA